MENPLNSIPELPEFEKIHPEHVEPALDLQLNENKQQLRNLFAENPSLTWENVIHPLEDLSVKLNRMWTLVTHLTHVFDTPELRKVYHRCLPKMTDYMTELKQNESIFQAVAALHTGASWPNLQDAQKKVIENSLRDFKLAGVHLPPAQKERMREINSDLANLNHKFEENVLDATTAWSKLITDEKELAGLPETALQKKLGSTPNIVNGRRITDETTLEVTKMVFGGKTNLEILAALQRNNIASVGLSGIDGKIIEAARRSPQTIFNQETHQQEIIDYGFVGDIKKVNSNLLWTLLDNNFTPVIAPLAADNDGVILNINADTVAAAIASSLSATKLIILSNIDGVYDKNKNILASLSIEQARNLISDGTISNGMLPKIQSIITAIEAGVQTIQIINGLKPKNLVENLFKDSFGTLIMK